MNSRFNENLINDWWRKILSDTGECEPFPGNLVLFVGAGISNDPPTELPLGATLTNALMEILFHPHIKAAVEGVFKSCSSVLGRNIPRLEHILGVACNEYHNLESDGDSPKCLLKIFAGRSPNRNHKIIAKHLAEKRGWIITTNFDECIELAYLELTGEKLPVYVLSKDETSLINLNGSLDDNWGLVKLHGTISQTVENLAATISVLFPGLSTPISELLDSIFKSADLIVVVGYSGTDHFDVNAWIRGRQNNPKKPKLIWINHQKDSNPKPYNQSDPKSIEEEAKMSASVDRSEYVVHQSAGPIRNSPLADAKDFRVEPYITWWSSFSQMYVLCVNTSDYLERLLNKTCPPEILGSATRMVSLIQALKSLYNPTDEQKQLNGVQLCIAIGLGQLAQEQILRYDYRNLSKEQQYSFFPAILEKMGKYPEAREQLVRRKGHGRISTYLQSVKLLRNERLPVKALLEVVKCLFNGSYCRASINDRFDMKVEAFDAWFDIFEALQDFAFFRFKPIRWSIEKLTLGCFYVNIDNQIKKVKAPLGLSVKGKLQMLQLRKDALLDDDYLHIFEVIDKQYSPPQLWLDSGPFVPGYILIGLSSCKEEDRLADLVQMSLSSVRILLSALRRHWPDGVRSVAQDDYTKVQYCDWVIRRYINIADDVACALGEPHLKIAVENIILKVNEVLDGLSIGDGTDAI